ncbi:heparan-alpha-glucosaminide N-acetyltransferase isoform X1 [Apis mellifera carnica]|nr:heparan-alpha-glucosaminide N-acetyltransferase isoform X1 [Apis mellifera carnica]
MDTMDEWFCDEESTLGYDEACINLRTNDKDSNAWLYLLSADCALRSILMFLIGLSLNTVSTGPQLETIRIFGVLQRFGITYFIVALIYLCLMTRKPKKTQSPMLKEVQDFLLLLPQWCVMLVIVAVHCFITFCLKVPGCPTGYLGPGGLHDDAKYFDCVGGAAGYIDRMILKESHLHHSATVYKSGPYDPEGILGHYHSYS